MAGNDEGKDRGGDRRKGKEPTAGNDQRKYRRGRRHMMQRAAPSFSAKTLATDSDGSSNTAISNSGGYERSPSSSATTLPIRFGSFSNTAISNSGRYGRAPSSSATTLPIRFGTFSNTATSNSKGYGSAPSSSATTLPIRFGTSSNTAISNSKGYGSAPSSSATTLPIRFGTFSNTAISNSGGRAPSSSAITLPIRFGSFSNTAISNSGGYGRAPSSSATTLPIRFGSFSNTSISNSGGYERAPSSSAATLATGSGSSSNIAISNSGGYERAKKDPIYLYQTMMSLALPSLKFKGPVDLHRMFVEVTDRGGIDKVRAQRRLREVCAALPRPLNDLSNKDLCFMYFKLLYPSEVHFCNFPNVESSNHTSSSSSTAQIQPSTVNNYQSRTGSQSGLNINAPEYHPSSSSARAPPMPGELGGQTSPQIQPSYPNLNSASVNNSQPWAGSLTDFYFNLAPGAFPSFPHVKEQVSYNTVNQPHPSMPNPMPASSSVRPSALEYYNVANQPHSKVLWVDPFRISDDGQIQPLRPQRASLGTPQALVDPPSENRTQVGSSQRPLETQLNAAAQLGNPENVEQATTETKDNSGDSTQKTEGL